MQMLAHAGAIAVWIVLLFYFRCTLREALIFFSVLNKVSRIETLRLCFCSAGALGVWFMLVLYRGRTLRYAFIFLSVLKERRFKVMLAFCRCLRFVIWAGAFATLVH